MDAVDLIPVFLKLAGRPVLLVGGGRVAEGKLHQLLAAGARVRVVAPEVDAAIRATAVVKIVETVETVETLETVEIAERCFVPADLDDVWLVVAAATPEVNRAVAEAAEARRIFVNAVDDPANASAFLSGVVRRDGVTIAISTSGEAPALTALLREALDAVLPADLKAWVSSARDERVIWRRERVPIAQRKPLLLRSLNRLYPSTLERPADSCGETDTTRARAIEDGDTRVPWLHAPEDSWL
jgi:uroporphyrin-III C-methyltransferase / precorrin-2 dehydrogenase / sirohydrochlorin ferrochelatase